MGNYREPQSANEAALQNLLGEQNELREPQSVTEFYLKEILEKGGGGGSGLPDVTSDDNGDVLGVVNGGWAKTKRDFIVTLTDLAEPEFGVYLVDKSSEEICNAMLSGKNVRFRRVKQEDETIFYKYFSIVGWEFESTEYWIGTITDGYFNYEVEVFLDEELNQFIMDTHSIFPVGSLFLNMSVNSYDSNQAILSGEIMPDLNFQGDFNLLWKICDCGGPIKINLSYISDNMGVITRFGPILMMLSSCSLIYDGNGNPERIWGVAPYYIDPFVMPTFVEIEITPPQNDGDNCGITIYQIYPSNNS